MSATVGAEITVRGLDPGSIARLRSALRYRNPEYVKLQMTGGHSEQVDPFLHACEELSNGDLVAPRGSVFEIRSTLLARGIKVAWDDQRSRGQPLDLQLRGLELRDYQGQGVEQLRKYLQGIIVLPCGGGKTILGIASIAKLGLSALVIVPTRDLVDQWKQDVDRYLGAKASIFGSGKHDIGTVTIATKDALLHHRGLDLSRFGTVVFDECHRVPSRTHQQVMARLPARYRLGLTATPTRSDGTTRLIHLTFGEVLLEKQIPEMVSNGWLVLPEVQAIYTPFFYRFPEEPNWYDYNAITNAIMADESRNERIASLVKAEPNETWLILCPSRKKHCHKLAERLLAAGVKALAVTGDMPSAKRKQAMQDLRDGKLTAMCATSLANEGLNIRRLSRIVLALPESSRANTTQRIGRCMRPLGSKKPVVYDIVDAEVPKLKSRWSTRKSEYRKLGLKVNSCPTLDLFR